MPTKQKAPHHKGTYHTASKRVRDQANANPHTRCWRCNRTLAEIRQTKPNARWTAGHVNRAEVDGLLLPECSPCNYSHGAAIGNRSPKRKHGRAWRPPQPLYTSRPW